MSENLLAESQGCQCGHHTEEPVLVASEIPQAIRHGAIFGAIAQVRSGASMILVAPHDPARLIAQLREREGDAITIEYVEREPGWKLRISRK